MPLPLILGIAAGVAGGAGLIGGIHGGVKMKEANDTMKSVKAKHEENINHLEQNSNIASVAMDCLGKAELEALDSFKRFTELFEKLHNKPEFKEIKIGDITIPEYHLDDIKQASVGAGVLLGSLGGAALGTAGGFAASGATTAAVMALGTASTGTAISTLSGAAATNAILAALGGGSLAAGGGGIALGTAVLGAASAGVALLVGGVIFGVTGTKLSDKADKAKHQMHEAEMQINKICYYLRHLKNTADRYCQSIKNVYGIYSDYIEKLSYIIEARGKTDWSMLNDEEKLVVENTVLLVSLLYKMCKVQIVLKSDNEDGLNKINTDEIFQSENNAEKCLEKVAAQFT